MQFPEPEDNEDPNQSFEDWAYVTAAAMPADGPRPGAPSSRAATWSESDEVEALEDMLYRGRQNLGRELFTIHSNAGPSTQDAAGSTDSGAGHTISGGTSSLRMTVAAWGRSASGAASGTAAFIEDCQVDGFDASVSRQVEATSRSRALVQSGSGHARPISAAVSPQLPSRRASSSVNLRAPSVPDSGPEPGRGSFSMRLLPGSRRRSSQAPGPCSTDSYGFKSSDPGGEVSNELVNYYGTGVRSGATAHVSSGRPASRSRGASRSSIYAASDISALMLPGPATAGDASDISALMVTESARPYGADGQNVTARGASLAKPGPENSVGSAVANGSHLEGGMQRMTVTVSSSRGQSWHIGLVPVPLLAFDIVCIV